MGKRLKLETRALGSELDIPNIATLAQWILDHRGTAGDLINYWLEESLSPQISAGITIPCAGGIFYKDRIIDCLMGLKDGIVRDEIWINTESIVYDAIRVVGQKKGVWFAIPAPHVLGITDNYYNDEDEWCEAMAGIYRILMRSMRDVGIAGHVLICQEAYEAEVEALARQKVFFFHPDPNKEIVLNIMESQNRIAVNIKNLDMVLNLANEAGLKQLILVDADEESIGRTLSHLDPDQVMVGGYCTDKCETYWESLVESATYLK